jgi:hypothetical protein
MEKKLQKHWEMWIRAERGYEGDDGLLFFLEFHFFYFSQIYNLLYKWSNK